MQQTRTPVVIGVDPGSSGGFAVLTLDGDVLAVGKWPETEVDTLEVLTQFVDWNVRLAMIEKVHAMPGEGVSSAFKFGYSQGFLSACLLAAAYPLQRVSPVRWQKPFDLPKTKDVGKTKKKNAHKARAQEFFPSVKITHAIADALLIAEYCRQQVRAA